MTPNTQSADAVHDSGESLSPAAAVMVCVLACLMVAVGFTFVLGKTTSAWGAYLGAHRADQATVAGTLHTRYGATIADATVLPAKPGEVADDVIVALPTGLASCTVVVATGVDDVGLLCGRNRTEPVRR